MTEERLQQLWRRRLLPRWREGFIPWTIKRGDRHIFRPASPRQIKAMKRAGRFIVARASWRVYHYIVTDVNDQVLHRFKSKLELWTWFDRWVIVGIKQDIAGRKKLPPLPKKRRRRKKKV